MCQWIPRPSPTRLEPPPVCITKEICVTEARISAICSGKRTITADTALRLAAFFGTTSGFWLGLQADFDLRSAQAEIGRKLEKEIAPYAAAA